MNEDREMKVHPGQLPVPPKAAQDPKGRELARIWAAKGAQYVTLAADLWEDPAAWGIMLVDLARHVAKAYQASNGSDPSATLERIKEGFDAEWLHSTEN